MKILEKEARLKGESIKSLADKIGISQTAVYKWLEDNATVHPSPKNVLKLKELGFSDTACLDPSKEVDA